jgi:hypothetical protein
MFPPPAQRDDLAAKQPMHVSARLRPRSGSPSANAAPLHMSRLTTKPTEILGNII